MKTVHLGRLQQAASARKPGYLETIQKAGKQITIRGQPFVQLSDADHAAIRKQFALAKPITVQSPGLPLTPKSSPLGLGDIIHKVALPIAKAFKLDCVDKTTGQLKPDSKCAQRRAALNKITLRE
jgi:hypothetical protein